MNPPEVVLLCAPLIEETARAYAREFDPESELYAQAFLALVAQLGVPAALDLLTVWFKALEVVNSGDSGKETALRAFNQRWNLLMKEVVAAYYVESQQLKEDLT